MKIRITFRHLPASGKFQRGKKYYVKYNNKDTRLPKFIWDRL